MTSELDALLAQASALLDANRLDEAEATYAECDRCLGNERSPRHAEVLVCLAYIARRRGSLADAAAHLDLALAIFPSHRAAVAQRLEIARELEDHATAAVLGLRSFRFAENDDERLRLLDRVALDALDAAAGALRAALFIRRGDRALLERMRAIHEAAGEYDAAVNVAVDLAEANPMPAERARAFVAAADLCAQKTNNVDRAVALYEAAIADDPAVPGAFEAIEQVLLDSGDVVGTEKAYVRQLERLRGRNAEEAEAALLSKLASIREDRLADWEDAVAALDRLVAMRPQDANARMRLATLLEEHGQDGLAVRCLEVAARIAPKHVPTFRALLRVSQKRNDLDRAWTAAAVLVHHEEADPEEQAMYRAHAPRVALTPSRAVDDAAFALLHPEDHDPVVSAIVSSIAPAAVAARIEQLRAKKLVPKVDPKDRQDLERSTVSAVRTVGWAARLFGMRPPDVYVRPGDPSAFVHLPLPETSFALGDLVLTGRTVPELAYMLGYELAYMRAADRLLAFFPTLPELRSAVIAGIAVAMPTELPPDVATTSATIAAKLDAVQRKRLSNAVRALGERGGQLDVLGWARSLERTACRAGLLACGDLNVAARLIAIDGRTIGGLTAADRVRDLVTFSVSEPHARLRLGLGVAIGTPRPSLRPPTA